MHHYRLLDVHFFVAGKDRTHDLRIMGPTRCQLRYCRLNCAVRDAAIVQRTTALPPIALWALALLASVARSRHTLPHGLWPASPGLRFAGLFAARSLWSPMGTRDQATSKAAGLLTRPRRHVGLDPGTHCLQQSQLPAELQSAASSGSHQLPLSTAPVIALLVLRGLRQVRIELTTLGL